MISSAEASSGNQTVEFNSSLTSGGPATIALNGNSLQLNHSSGTVTIQGPTGAKGITIDAQSSSGVIVDHSSGAVEIDNLTITGGNDANGGGIFQDGAGLLTINNSTITGNTASNAGGGVMGTSIAVVASTISSNSAGVYGGGLAGTATITITGSTVSGNISSYIGGGILATYTSSLTITDSTIAMNQGDAASGVLTDANITTIKDSTIDGNSSPTWGTAIYGTGSYIIIAGSIVSDNAGGDLYGYFAMADDLIGDTYVYGASGLVPLDPYGSQDIIWGTSAGLAPLGYYGGPTQTMPPLAGSAAIGAYVDIGVSRASTDQRGFTMGNDLGAFQTQSNPLEVNTTSDDPVASGDLSLRDAANLANALGGDQTVTFDSSLTATSAATITLNTSATSLDDTTGTVTIDGSANAHTLTVNPATGSGVFGITSGSTAKLTSIAVGGTVSVSGTLILAGAETGGDVTVATGATVELDGNQTLSSLTISPGGTAQLDATAGQALIVGALTIDGPDSTHNGGVLDLGNGDLIVRSTAASGIVTLLAAGYDGGFWDGAVSSGLYPAAILSSVAASDPYQIKTLGYAQIGSGYANLGLSTFDGQTVSGGDTVVALTYYGDANLDRTADGSDYTPLDNGFNMGLTTWAAGDFNYDRTVDTTDYDVLGRSSTILSTLSSTTPGVTSDAISVSVPASGSGPNTATVTIKNIAPAATSACTIAVLFTPPSTSVYPIYNTSPIQVNPPGLRPSATPAVAPVTVSGSNGTFSITVIAGTPKGEYILLVEVSSGTTVVQTVAVTINVN